jgi:hypothetical protein
MTGTLHPMIFKKYARLQPMMGDILKHPGNERANEEKILNAHY